MKPKPLESLNHLTVPVAIADSYLRNAATISGRDEAGHDDQGRDLAAIHESCDELLRELRERCCEVQIRCLMNHCGGEYSTAGRAVYLSAEPLYFLQRRTAARPRF